MSWKEASLDVLRLFLFLLLSCSPGCGDGSAAPEDLSVSLHDVRSSPDDRAPFRDINGDLGDRPELGLDSTSDRAPSGDGLPLDGPEDRARWEDTLIDGIGDRGKDGAPEDIQGSFQKDATAEDDSRCSDIQKDLGGSLNDFPLIVDRSGRADLAGQVDLAGRDDSTHPDAFVSNDIRREDSRSRLDAAKEDLACDDASTGDDLTTTDRTDLRYPEVTTEGDLERLDVPEFLDVLAANDLGGDVSNHVDASMDVQGADVIPGDGPQHDADRPTPTDVPALPDASPDAVPPLEICNDGLDNDQNGLTDCADAACDGRVCDGDGHTCQEGACVGLLSPGQLIWVKAILGQTNSPKLGLLNNECAISSSEFSGMIILGEDEDIVTLTSSGFNRNRYTLKYTSKGRLEWAKKEWSTVDCGSSLTAVHGDGRFVLAGWYEGTMFFGDNDELSLSDAGETYIVYYDARGEPIWATRNTQLGDISPSLRYVLEFGFEGEILLASTLYYGTEMILGEGEENETDFHLWYDEAGFYLARYNEDGTLAWAREGITYHPWMGNFTHVEAITTVGDLAVITGEYYVNLTLGGRSLHTEDPSSDGFLAAFTPTGQMAWMIKIGGEGYAAGTALGTFPDGSLLVIGTFNERVVFGEGQPNETTLESPHERERLFIARYSPEGTFLDVSPLGTADAVYGMALYRMYLTTQPDGSFALAGRFSGEMTLGEGEPGETTLVARGDSNIFLARYNPDATLAWTLSLGESQSNIASDIIASSEETLLVSGYVYQCPEEGVQVIFGEGEPEETILPTTYDGEECSSTSFIAKYRW